MAPSGVDLVRVIGSDVPSGVDIVRVILSVANKDDNDDDGVLLLLDKTTSAEPSSDVLLRLRQSSLHYHRPMTTSSHLFCLSSQQHFLRIS